MTKNNTLIRLVELKESLSTLMDPKLLEKLASLLQSFGSGSGQGRSFIEQFKFWSEKNGEGCRYSAMAKEFFLQENANNVAKEIINLYHSWAKHYENK